MINKLLRTVITSCCLFCFSTLSGQASFSDSLLLLMEEVKIDTHRINILNELAWYHKSDNPSLAADLANQALSLANKCNIQEGIANAEHNLGMINWYLGNYEQSSVYFFRALKIRETLGDSIGLARSYNNIGHLYFRQEDYEKAIEFYSNSYKIREVLKDSIGLVYSLNSIADVHNKLEDRQALAYYLKAKEIVESLKDQRAKEFVYTKLGEYYLANKGLERARKYFNLALEINQLEANRFNLSQNLNNLASLSLQQDSLEKAIGYSTQSLALSSQLDALELQADAAKVLSEAYAQKGEYKLAYQYHLQHADFQTAILNSSTEKAIIEIQTKYDSEKQKSGLLNQLLDEEKKVNRLRTSLYISALIFVGIVVLLLGSRYRNQIRVNKLMQDKQKEIETSNEQLRYSNSALEQFAYVASHDLKEPLRTIGTYSSLLVRRNTATDDPEIQEFNQFIVGSVKQMYQLLDDLLAYSKLSKSIQRPKEEVNLNNTLKSVIQSLDHLIQNTGASIKSSELPTLKCVPSQIAQLFQNLITNAIKFNDNEVPEVKVNYQAETNHHHFWIQDNGIGIPLEYQTKIFQIFKRLHKPQYKGTGVGLAICEKIVQQHNGKIWVESEVNKGSTFHFTIPI